MGVPASPIYQPGIAGVGAGVVLGGQFKVSDTVRGDLFIGPQMKSVTTTIGEHFIYGEEEWVPGIRFGMNFGWTR